MIKIGSLFAGIGGFELGIERAISGSSTIWQVEQNEFCQRILKKHWPNAIIYNDVKHINKNNVEPVDILLGGFPCQDISVAGKGKGINEGKKSSLYFEMHRIISELRPRIVVMENVPAITNRGLSEVLGSLSEIGYDAEWTIISASQFGAPHLRKRWFCVAYPNMRSNIKPRNETTGNKSGEKGKTSSRKKNQERQKSRGETQFFDRRFDPLHHAFTDPNAGRSGSNGEIQAGRDPIKAGDSRSHAPNSDDKHIKKQSVYPCRMEKKRFFECRTSKKRGIYTENYWQGFPTQSPFCNRNDGIPDRLAKLRALGNAIVPQCSEWIGQQILKSGLLEDDHELR